MIPRDFHFLKFSKFSCDSLKSKKVGSSFAFLFFCGTVFGLQEGDSLVSRSYLEEVLLPSIQGKISSGVSDGLEETYGEKIALVEELRREIGALQQESASGVGLVSVSCGMGDEISLPEGSVIVAQEGVFSLGVSGTVVNLSTGTVASEGGLELGQQYLVAEESTGTVLVQSGTGTVWVLGAYSVTEGDGGSIFSDVSSEQWFFGAVDFVVSENLFLGTSETEFSPYLTMDRGMMMTVLYRLAGSPEAELSGATETFVDVADEDWFADYVRWGATQKLTAGVGEGYFMPQEEVTRQQVLVMLRAFAADYLGVDVSGRGSLEGFSDRGTVADWAEESVSWAVASGLLQGIPSSDTLLRADENGSRAEVAMILMNFYHGYL